MSHNNNKGKISGFKLSSSFNQLYSNKKQQTQQFIKQITQKSSQPHNNSKQKQKSRQKSLKKLSSSHQPNTSLFKLNTHSESLLSDIPVQYIKKKSQSRLQSINDSQYEKNNKFSLLEKVNQNDRHNDKKQAILKDRKELLKKYNIDLNAVMSQQQQQGQNMVNGKGAMDNKMQIQQEQPQNVVKPSQLYSVNPTKQSDPFTTPTIFQTPLLPCFSSQFTNLSNPQFLTHSKTIKQPQGVYHIGKIRINKKSNKAIIKIGQIQYESQFISSQGKFIGIKEDFMYKLKNWNGIWVSQTKQEDL